MKMTRIYLLRHAKDPKKFPVRVFQQTCVRRLKVDGGIIQYKTVNMMKIQISFELWDSSWQLPRVFSYLCELVTGICSLVGQACIHWKCLLLRAALLCCSGDRLVSLPASGLSIWGPKGCSLALLRSLSFFLSLSLDCNSQFISS